MFIDQKHFVMYDSHGASINYLFILLLLFYTTMSSNY